jgi:hypothetical protein
LEARILECCYYGRGTTEEVIASIEATDGIRLTSEEVETALSLGKAWILRRMKSRKGMA